MQTDIVSYKYCDTTYYFFNNEIGCVKVTKNKTDAK